MNLAPISDHQALCSWSMTIRLCLMSSPTVPGQGIQ